MSRRLRDTFVLCFVFTSIENALNDKQNNIKNGKTKKEKYKMYFSWWERMDSYHRRHSQQIYSLSPLAARELSHVLSLIKMELVDGFEPPTC